MTLSIFIGVALIICSYSYSGRLKMIYFPPIDADYATARLVMPEGTLYETTETKLQRMIDEAHKLQAEYLSLIHISEPTRRS